MRDACSDGRGPFAYLGQNRFARCAILRRATLYLGALTPPPKRHDRGRARLSNRREVTVASVRRKARGSLSSLGTLLLECLGESQDVVLGTSLVTATRRAFPFPGTTGQSRTGHTPRSASINLRRGSVSRARTLETVGPERRRIRKISKPRGRERSPSQAQLTETLQPRRPHPRKVDRGGDRHQRLIGADIGRRLRPPDVLLARLKGQHKAASAVDIERLPRNAPRYLADELRFRRKQPGARPPIRDCVPREIPFRRDVGTQRARGSRTPSRGVRDPRSAARRRPGHATPRRRPRPDQRCSGATTTAAARRVREAQSVLPSSATGTPRFDP